MEISASETIHFCRNTYMCIYLTLLTWLFFIFFCACKMQSWTFLLKAEPNNSILGVVAACARQRSEFQKGLSESTWNNTYLIKIYL